MLERDENMAELRESVRAKRGEDAVTDLDISSAARIALKDGIFQLVAGTKEALEEALVEKDRVNGLVSSTICEALSEAYAKVCVDLMDAAKFEEATVGSLMISSIVGNFMQEVENKSLRDEGIPGLIKDLARKGSVQ